ncbi:hypothetical protein B0H19DRAFT_1270304 [Mycena capillaripes]|nr:hypothetical protein B0H19DRAFT_1270304 [Mycena capillaripes]
MHFNIILTTLLLATGFSAGLTLPEAVEAEKRQCLGTNANCILFNPGACCSGQCCCGFDSAFGDGCTDTPCSPAQEAGTIPGHCSHIS